MSDTYSFVNKTKGKLTGLPFAHFEEMKDAVLGKDYDLSVAIIDDEEMQTLNREHRDKDYVTDILSFPYDEKSGEIFLNLNACKKKAAEFDRTYENYLGFVFIHGLVHLKGYDHGSKMESIEAKFRKKFRF